MGFMKCPNCSKDISDQAETCPSCGHPIKETALERKFHELRMRILTGSAILCGFAIPVGLILKEPTVWILGILGIVVVVGKRFYSKSKE